MENSSKLTSGLTAGQNIPVHSFLCKYLIWGLHLPLSTYGKNPTVKDKVRICVTDIF